MSTPMQNLTSPPSWREIARLVQRRTASDYRTKVRPAVRRGRVRLRSWIATLGRKVQGANE